MKKITMFLLSTIVIVVILASCNNQTRVTIKNVRVVGLVSSPAVFDSNGWCECYAVAPSGDTIQVSLCATDYYMYKVNIAGDLEIFSTGEKLFFSYPFEKGNDIPAEIRFPYHGMQTETGKTAKYICYAHVPSGDSLEVVLPEPAYLSQKLPIKGYVYVSGAFARVVTFSKEKMRG